MHDLIQTELEAEVADVVARFHREQQGHPPDMCHARMLDEMIVVRSTGVFTPTEQTLCASEEGRKLIQSARREQRTLTRRTVEGRIAKIIRRPILRSYYDLDVRFGEQIEVYILA